MRHFGSRATLHRRSRAPIRVGNWRAGDDASDSAAIDEAMARIDAGEMTVPGTVAFAMARGDRAVAAWRRHRGFSQAKLAKCAGLNPAHLWQIETGRRNASLAAYGCLARALGVDRDLLLLAD
jgi:DNA-binding XRE family transcriptional regulator